jgi:hypothetical protein
MSFNDLTNKEAAMDKTKSAAKPTPATKAPDTPPQKPAPKG